MNRFLSSVGLCILLAAPVGAEPAKDAVQKVSATFEPASAKPGETVTLKVTIELADGFHTYPVTQPAAEGKFMTNKIVFPATGPIVFVGTVADPAGAKSKKEEDHELLYYPGGGTWERKAVVSPLAQAGATEAKLKIRLLVCTKDNCFPPKTIEVDASLKVLAGPAVEVEKAYRDEVEKAIRK